MSKMSLFQQARINFRWLTLTLALTAVTAGLFLMPATGNSRAEAADGDLVVKDLPSVADCSGALRYIVKYFNKEHGKGTYRHRAIAYGF